MGAYVYGLQTPSKIVKIVVDGSVVEAGQIKYIFKPYNGYSDAQRLNTPYWATIERMSKKWDGQQTPEYVIISDGRLVEGQRVLRWRAGQFSIVDDSNWGGMEVVGELERQGKSWVLVPVKATSCETAAI